MGLFDRIRTFFRPSIYVYDLGGDAPTQVLNYTAKRLYQTQDNLRAVLDFLTRSIAQLPLKVYIREGESDRRRDRDSVAARLLWRPNPDQTEYEFFLGLSLELLLFGAVYMWVIPDSEMDSGWQIRIIPTEWITEHKSKDAYSEEYIRVVSTTAGAYVDIPYSEFVAFKLYSPGNPGGYLSPVSGLRQVLTEQIEAGNFRKELWHSSGRLNAQIVRPANVQQWDDAARKRFITAFRESWGAGGSKAGSIPLLEDGMEIKTFQPSFKESQWYESVKLSRESVAAAYGINPSLVWHSDAQTYASAKDAARALYAECLGPTLQMIQQRINAFLLPMIGADPRTYVEFDLTEKIKGSFEERAGVIQAAVGGPWLTRNEARADNNLPPLPGGDDLIVPLNVVTGGQASPQDTHMDPQEPMTTQPTDEPDEEEIEKWAAHMIKLTQAGECGCSTCKKSGPDVIRIKARSSKDEDDRMGEVLASFFRRQRNAVLPRIGAGGEWWNQHRWDKELADDIEPIIDDVADAHGREVAAAIGSEYDTEITRNYLRTLAEGRAAAINESTRKKLQESLDDLEEGEDEDDEEKGPAHVFDLREGKHAELLGRSLALVAAGWAANHEAPQQAERQGIEKTVEKRWITGTNPRPAHAAMDGETVPIDQPFSNGLDWPGDEDGDPDETCGCNCSTEVIITVN